MKKVVCMGSRPWVVEDGTTQYRCFGTNGETFWSPEPISGGIAVCVTERIAGTKYTKKDGTPGEVKKNGFNLDYVIGGPEAISNIKASQLALVELG